MNRDELKKALAGMTVEELNGWQARLNEWRASYANQESGCGYRDVIEHLLLCGALDGCDVPQYWEWDDMDADERAGFLASQGETTSDEHDAYVCWVDYANDTCDRTRRAVRDAIADEIESRAE